jgi:HPt (histidine-containing phosphotransfer) domain-containing protein
VLYQASHALKSASANVGAVVLSSHCAQLEALAKSGVVSDAVPMVGTIREDYRVVEAILSARLPQVA